MIYTLCYFEEGREVSWLCFEQEQEMRAFMAILPGYTCEADVDGYETHSLDLTKSPDYAPIAFKGNVVPFSRFMFKETTRVELSWRELPNVSTPNQGLLSGVIPVDAYSIPYEAVETYVATREAVYRLITAILGEQGIKTMRAYHGSEDGEAILYQQPDEPDWHFLTHLDPSVVACYDEGELAVRAWLQEALA